MVSSSVPKAKEAPVAASAHSLPSQAASAQPAVVVLITVATATEAAVPTDPAVAAMVSLAHDGVFKVVKVSLESASCLVGVPVMARVTASVAVPAMEVVAVYFCYSQAGEVSRTKVAAFVSTIQPMPSTTAGVALGNLKY